MEVIQEKARDVGRLIAQTDEYKAIRRANEQLSNDREAVTLLNRIQEIQEQLQASLQRGEEPGQEEQDRFESIMQELQGMTVYQGMVTAQSNFDRLMKRINEEIGKGIEAGEQSRIIL